MANNTNSRTIKSVATSTDIIDVIRDQNGATVTKIANQLDLSPATIHSHLSTLKQDGYVVQNKTIYNLGPQFLAAGEHVRNKSNLYKASKEEIDLLAEDTEECVHLIIEHKGKLYALYERFGPNAIGTDYHNKKRGKPLNHLHCTAAGKSILAQLPKERLNEIVSGNELPKNTENTIVEKGRLFEELATVRERGYAFADEEQLEGIRAIGAPVCEPSGEVAGAVAISGPTSRLQGEQYNTTFPKKILQTANICEVKLRTLTLT